MRSTCAEYGCKHVCSDTFLRSWMIKVYLNLGTRLRSFGNQFEVLLLDRWVGLVSGLFPQQVSQVLHEEGTCPRQHFVPAPSFRIKRSDLLLGLLVLGN